MPTAPSGALKEMPVAIVATFFEMRFHVGSAVAATAAVARVARRNILDLSTNCGGKDMVWNEEKKQSSGRAAVSDAAAETKGGGGGGWRGAASREIMRAAPTRCSAC
jgi:hypothetical protein